MEDVEEEMLMAEDHGPDLIHSQDFRRQISVSRGGLAYYHCKEEERETPVAHESLDYLPSHSKVYKKWLQEKTHRKEWDRWLLMGLIGTAVGMLGFLTHQIIDSLIKLKWDLVENYLQFICPAGSPSGLPEIIGYLNGTSIQHLFNIKTFLGTFVSCVLAVASGLFCGPEGPMIHLGALLGCGLSQLQSDTLGIHLPIFTRFRNSADKGHFGFFEAEKRILFWVKNLLDINVLAFIPTILLGMLGGLLGALFVSLNIRINKLLVSVRNYQLSNNSEIINQFKREISEYSCSSSTWIGPDGVRYSNQTFNQAAALLVENGKQGITYLFKRGTHEEFEYASLCTALAFYFILSCWTAGSAVASGLVIPMLYTGALYGRIIGLILVSIFGVQTNEYGAWIDPGLFAAVGAASFFSGVSRLTISLTVIMTPQASAHLFFLGCLFLPPMLTLDPHPQLFAANGRCGDIFLGKYKDQPYDLPSHSFLSPTSLDQLATLLAFASEQALSSAFVIVGFFVTRPTYFKQSGYSISTYPPLMLQNYHRPPEIWESDVRFNVEITNDVQSLLLIMLAVMVAKMVGDLFNSSLYSSLLKLKCIPYLNVEPFVRHRRKWLNLELFSASDIMESGVRVLHLKENVACLARLLASTSHGGFPVVCRPKPDHEEVFQGTIKRDYFIILTTVKTEDMENLRKKAIGNPISSHPSSLLKLQHLWLLEIVIFGPKRNFNKNIIAHAIEVENGEVWTMDRPEQCFGPEHAESGKGSGWIITFVLNVYIFVLELCMLLENEHIFESEANDESLSSSLPLSYEKITVEKLPNPLRLTMLLNLYTTDPRYQQLFINLEPYVNKSAMSVQAHFSLHRTYIIFRTLGLRHLTVVDLKNRVVGVITRKDLMPLPLAERLRLRLATQAPDAGEQPLDSRPWMCS
ncbi:chloride channel protein C [Columba livia]|nr:chloride channel protein C [Columba livia]